jgi:transcription termination factor Rho
MNIAQLEAMTLSDLRSMSKDLEIPGATRMKKEDLILRIMQVDAERRGLELRGGVLEIMNEGMGFLRSDHYLPGPNDIYVSQSQIRRFNLRTGDLIVGQVRPPKETEKYF